MYRSILFLLLAISICCLSSIHAKRVTGRSCQELKGKNVRKSGVYSIKPCQSYPYKTVKVYCDMETDDGGWTIIQRRDNYTEQENFTRSWEAYANGFGSMNKDFWLGNDVIHCLTSQLPTTVRFDLEDFEGQTAWAKYSTFSVEDRDNLFKLEVTGYTGNASDSFSNGRHNGMKFTTVDNDNDITGGNCAQVYKGGWWYDACHNVNLNGLYFEGGQSPYGVGVNWRFWKGYHYSLKKTEMKIRGSGTLPPWTTEAPYTTSTFPATGANCTTSGQTYQHGEAWYYHCRDLTCNNGRVHSTLNSTCCQSGKSDHSNGNTWLLHCNRYTCDNGAAHVIGEDPKCRHCRDRKCSNLGGFCIIFGKTCDGKIRRKACRGKNCVCCIPKCI